MEDKTMGWPIQDNFNRVDADALGSMSDGVHSWTEIIGDIDIVSNTAKATLNSECQAIVAETHTETDYYVQALCALAVSRDPGVSGRHSDSNNLYLWRQVELTSLDLYKKVSGSWTVLASVTALSAGSYTLKLEMNGTTIKGYVDGVEKASVTDSALSSGKPGIRSAYINSTWDDFYADSLGAAAGPTYPQLERDRRGIERGILIGAP